MLKFILSNALSFCFSVGRYFTLHNSVLFQFFYPCILLKPTQVAVTTGWSWNERRKSLENQEQGTHGRKESQSSNPEQGQQADVCVRKGVSRALGRRSKVIKETIENSMEGNLKEPLVLILVLISSCPICNSTQQPIHSFLIGRGD